MRFRIALGETAAKMHPDCHLYIDNHLAHYGLEFLGKEFTGEILDDPSDTELASRLDDITDPQVEIITTLQGRYSLSMIGKIANRLRDHGIDVMITVDTIPEDIRRFIGAPRIQHHPAMDTSIHSERPLKIFLCHCSLDKEAVRSLYVYLRRLGADVWFDEERLLPGQDWNAEIQAAVAQSELVIVCLSPKAINKVGYVQKEIRYALDIADEQPEGSIYIVPVKLQECDVPTRLKRWQWLDIYDNGGHDKLAQTLYARVAELRKREEASRGA